MTASLQLGLGNKVARVAVVAKARRFGMSLAAVMLAGTALVPAASQTADLGGLTVSRNDFVNFPGLIGSEPNEVTNGLLRINPLSPQTFAGDLTDSGGVFSILKFGASDLTLAGFNTHSGTTVVQGGQLIVGSATALSANSRLAIAGPVAALATVDLNGFNSQVNGLVGNATGVLTSTTGAAILTIDSAINLTYNGALQGQVGIVKRGSGIQTFTNLDPASATTNATGPITLAAGGFRLGSSNALGSGTMTVTGASTLAATSGAPISFDNNIVLQDRLTLSAPSPQSLILGGDITGAGSLTKIGVGDVTLLGNNDYSGGTTLSGGRVFIGNASALGSGTVTQTQTTQIGLANPAVGLTLANDFQLNSTALQILTPDVLQVITLSGDISGDADVNLVAGNGGMVVLTGNNSFLRSIRVRSGTLGIANAAGVNSALSIRVEEGDRDILILNPDLVITTRVTSHFNDGPRTFSINTSGFNVEFAGALRDATVVDTLQIRKTGAGIFTASNTDVGPFNSNVISGGFAVVEGTLNLTGAMANGIEVEGGATLTGTGLQTVGATVIADGGTLSAGDARAASPAIGTLSLNNLTLGAGANTIFDLGAPSIDTVMPINDLIVVANNLDLGGSTFNFNILPGFTAGTYRLMTYGGALSGTANLGLLPVGFLYTLNTGGGNVDLDVQLIDFYWDGNGPASNVNVEGGSGTWNAGNSNWTDSTGTITAAWQNNARAFFTNVGGDVTVDGNFTYSTLFFTVDGYALNPAAGATLGADAGTIDVAAASTATINVDLVGTNGLSKAGGGTLVLSGTNSFTGGLSINAGTLAVTQAAALGADAVTVNGGAQTLRFNADMTVTNNINGVGVGYNIDTGANTVTLEGSLSGGGADKFGTGTLVLNNAINDQPNALAVFAGTLIVNGGVQGGVGGASASVIGGTGTITGLVSTNGTLSPGVAPGQVGTLTAGSLTLGAGSTSLFDLGVVGVVGGTNDLMVVNGNLILDGTLNVNPLAGWNIGTGSYRLFNYAGALTDSGLALGGILLTPPVDVSYTVNATVANQVNLDIGYTGAFNWDGNGAPVDGIIQGGNGTWNSSNTNWTNSDGLFNLAYPSAVQNVANFGGIDGGGVVDVVGVQAFQALNFLADGYVLTGGGSLVGSNNFIDVATGATATIDVPISGGGRLNIVGGGTLVLNGASDHGGQVFVAGTGPLVLDGSFTDGAGTMLVIGGATVAGSGSFAGSATFENGATLSPGNNGVGTLTFGNLTLSDTTNVNFQLGAANTLGSPLNDLVVVNGDLTLNGLLNVTQSAGGNFTVGIYNLFTYGGSLTDNGLTINGLLPGALTGTVQHNSAAQQINLVVGAAGVSVLNWDGTDFTAQPPGAPLAQGGNGTFNLTNTNWTGDAPGEINAAWVNNAVGIFGVTGGAVDVTDNIGFTGFGFQADGYTLGGAGTLTTNAATGSFVSVDSGLTAIINTVIDGTGQLFKQGSGTLVLGGNNTNSGGVSLQAGTIALTSGTGLGSGTLQMSNGTTLRADASLTLANNMTLNGMSNINTNGSMLTLNGVLSGPGALIKNNAGNLVLNGANNYAGGTVLNAGSITFTTNSAFGTGTIATTGGTALIAGQNDPSTGVTLALTNNLMLGAGSTFLDLQGSTGPGFFTDGTVSFNGTDLTLNGVISGTGTLDIGDRGRVTLNGVNSYSGGTTVTNAVVNVGSDRALGTGVLTVQGSDGMILGNNSGALRTLANDIALTSFIVVTGPNDITLNGVISGNQNISKASTSTLTLNGINTVSGFTSIFGGRITVGNNSALGTSIFNVFGFDQSTTLAAGTTGLTLANNVRLNVDSNLIVESGDGQFTLGGVISGAGALTKAQSGNLILTNANTYTGGTRINSGRITVANNQALSTGGVTMQSGTTLAAGAPALTVANAINMLGGASVDVGGQTFTLSGIISGTGPLSVIDGAANPASALVLTGINTYTGGTVITGTTVQVSQDANLGDAAGSITLVDGTLRTTASFATARTIGITGTTGTLDVATDTTLTTTGIISGNRLVKNGGGTLELNAVNTYTGGTALNAGTISINNNGSLGTGALAMAGGTTLLAAANNLVLTNLISTAGVGTINTAANTLTLNGVVSGAGSIAKIGTGTLVMNAANTYAGGTALNAGAITVGNSAALGTGVLTMADATTLNAGVTGLTVGNNIVTLGTGTINTGAAPADFTLTGAISGAGGITKQGTGLLNVTGASTYTGATTVAAGTLNVTGSLVSAVTVNSGAAITGTGTVGALSVLSGASVSPGAPGSTNVATLNVTGAATLAGTYNVNVMPAGADRITAGGPLVVGGALTVAPTGSFTQFNQVFTVASGSTRTGTFGTVTGLGLFGLPFAPVVEYTATQANIRLAPNSLVTIANGFGGLTGNALEAALAFDRAVAMGYNPQAFFAVYNSGAALPRTMRELSGEQRATERRVAMDSNRVIRETALDRLNLGLASMAGQQVKAGGEDSSLTLWLRGAGSWGKAETSGAATAFTTEQVGVLTGIDWARDGLTVGGMFHYTTTDIGFDVIGGSSRVETVGGTVYGGWRKPDSGIVVNGGLSVSSARSTGNRAISLAGFTQSLSGRTSGTTYQVFGELAFDVIKSGNTQVEPFVRNSYIGLDASALTEAGGVAALTAPKQSYNINVTNLGLRIGSTLPSGKVSLNGSVSWQRTSGSRDAATFIGIPAVGQFGNIRSVTIDPTSVLLQAGMGAKLSDSIRFGLDYSGLVGKFNQDHGARATLNFAF